MDNRDQSKSQLSLIQVCPSLSTETSSVSSLRHMLGYSRKGTGRIEWPWCFLNEAWTATVRFWTIWRIRIASWEILLFSAVIVGRAWRVMVLDAMVIAYLINRWVTFRNRRSFVTWLGNTRISRLAGSTQSTTYEWFQRKLLDFVIFMPLSSCVGNSKSVNLLSPTRM